MSSTINTQKDGKAAQENTKPAGNNDKQTGQPAVKDTKKPASGGTKQGNDADRKMKFLGISNEHSQGQYSPEKK
ncbi:MAG: hypothetical protein LQ348_002261 [Seirophora lacunosa]|nr:MAG: hypothetical protein LQ344_002177 [Seirophora lacunosa]KAI4196645.1 MAG: hypothetical protein LQ348_002261 [Seirophora lacunosa]